jgi:hypothetical protein
MLYRVLASTEEHEMTMSHSNLGELQARVRALWAAGR